MLRGYLGRCSGGVLWGCSPGGAPGGVLGGNLGRCSRGLSSAKAAASEQASSEITGISGWIQRQKGRLIQMSGLQQQNLVSYHGDG